jgi:hypothetical protein
MKLKLVVLTLGIICASQAAADPFNQFISFGDSSVDSGWWSGASYRRILVTEGVRRQRLELAI